MWYGANTFEFARVGLTIYKHFRSEASNFLDAGPHTSFAIPWHMPMTADRELRARITHSPVSVTECD
jgi:hypothetical protein